MSTSIQQTSPWEGELDPEREYQLLIDGELVDPADGHTFPCEYPFDGTQWGAAPLAGNAEVDAAVRAARRAFEGGWRDTKPATRAKLLRRLADLILEDGGVLARLQVHENGKLLTEMSWTGPGMADFAEFSASLAETSHGYTSKSNVDNTVSYVVREPIGVCAILTAWNSPLGLLSFKVFPALAAGNTVVIKPSEVTPLSTLRLGELFARAGFPAGVVNIVTGPGTTGRALVEHPSVDKIAFTGSTATGQAIAVAAAARSARVTLEMGGKSPNIIFADADYDKAINGIIKGIFSASGQTCMAGSRILVDAAIGDDFFDELRRRAEALRLGDPLDPSTEISPLASRNHLAKVLGYIDIAKNEGAQLFTGGHKPDGDELGRGFFVEPTLFTNVTNDLRIAREEVFGPVGAVIRFRDEDEAIRIANDTNYGLAAAVWTESLRRGHRVAGQLRAGTVWMNDYRTMEYMRPFGGYKQSGVGREQGIDALDPYTEIKSVFISTAS